MKKSDLKQLIKPLVKECIHEVLIEEGLLSNVVAEVAKGMQVSVITEAQQPQVDPITPTKRNPASEGRRKIQEHRKKLMDSIGSDIYNGVNLFEGTEPMNNPHTDQPSAGSTDLGNPTDAGVDISSLVGNASKVWKAIK